MAISRFISATVATIGAVAVIVLSVGTPSGAADELSDLRANSELLQRRLDEIHRTPTNSPSAGDFNGGGGFNGAAAGGGSFPRSFLIPGTDTSVRVGGTVNESLKWIAR